MMKKRVGHTISVEDKNKPLIEVAEEKVSTSNDKVETEEIPLSTPQSADSKIKIDFLNDEETSSFISQPTKPAPEEPKKEEEFSFSKQKPEEIRETLKKEKEEYAKELTVEDFQEVAEFIVNLIDMGVINIARWISKEKTDQPFEVNENKKRKLIKQLTLIAIKHKLKIGIELVFFATLIMVYAVPVRKAIKIRQEKADQKAKVDKDKLKDL